MALVQETIDFSVNILVNGVVVQNVRLAFGDPLPKEYLIKYKAGDVVTAQIDYDNDTGTTTGDDYTIALSANGETLWEKADLSGLSEGDDLAAAVEPTSGPDPSPNKGEAVSFDVGFGAGMSPWIAWQSWPRSTVGSFPPPPLFTDASGKRNGEVLYQRQLRAGIEHYLSGEFPTDSEAGLLLDGEGGRAGPRNLPFDYPWFWLSLRPPVTADWGGVLRVYQFDASTGTGKLQRLLNLTGIDVGQQTANMYGVPSKANPAVSLRFGDDWVLQGVVSTEVGFPATGQQTIGVNNRLSFISAEIVGRTGNNSPDTDVVAIQWWADGEDEPDPPLFKNGVVINSWEDVQETPITISETPGKDVHFALVVEWEGDGTPATKLGEWQGMENYSNGDVLFREAITGSLSSSNITVLLALSAEDNNRDNNTFPVWDGTVIAYVEDATTKAITAIDWGCNLYGPTTDCCDEANGEFRHCDIGDGGGFQDPACGGGAQTQMTNAPMMAMPLLAFFQQVEYNIGTAGDTVILQWWPDGHPKPDPPKADLKGASAKLRIHATDDACALNSVDVGVVFADTDCSGLLGGFDAAATGDVVYLAKMSDLTARTPDDYCPTATIPEPLTDWGGVLIPYRVATDGTATRLPSPMATGSGSQPSATLQHHGTYDMTYEVDGVPHEAWWLGTGVGNGFFFADQRIALQWWRDGEPEPSAPTTLEDIS